MSGYRECCPTMRGPQFAHMASCPNRSNQNSLCEGTVQACIDALPKVDACNQTAQFVAGLDESRAALTSLLPDPRRKKMEEALSEFIDSGYLQSAVDAAMGVE